MPVTESYGTLHANISVPSTATAGSYSVRLEVSPSDQFPGGADNTTVTESVPALPPAAPTGRGLRANGVAVHHAAGAAAVHPVRGHGHSHGAHPGRSWMHGEGRGPTLICALSFASRPARSAQAEEAATLWLSLPAT